MRLRIGKILPWVLAAAAVAFVASAVPVRDRCWDPHAASSTRVAVTRDASGCALHLSTGEVHIDARECGALTCEPGLASTLVHARTGVLVGLLVVYAVGTLAWAARWRALLGFADIDMSLLEVWRLSIEAQAGGVLLPGGLGGDAFRIASVLAKRPAGGEGTKRAPAAIVVASVLLDRAVGLAVVAALAAIGGFVWGGMGAGPVAWILAALPLAFVAGLAAVRALPIERLGLLAHRRIAGALQPVLDYARDPRAPRAIAASALCSLGLALTQLTTLRGLVFAVGAHPRAEQWIPMGMAMGFLAGSLPGLPGGWGTADAAYVYFFGLGGIAGGSALAVSLLFRMYWYGAAVVGAALQLSGTRARKRVPPSRQDR